MEASFWEGEIAERVTQALEAIAVTHYGPDDLTSYSQIQEIVRSGKAKQYFQPGDQIITPWKLNDNTTYQMPWDVVDFAPVVDEHGVTHENTLWIESHYALPGVQFSQNNAFYVPTSDMAAGTYHFKIGNNWGTHCVENKSYQFTTTKVVPANGQLILGTASSNTSGLPDTAPTNWRVRTFSNGMQDAPTEILALTEGTGGTDLGVLSSSTVYADSGINNIQRAAYGYNRWSVSAMRQWLNSDAAAGSWWTQKYPHDHRPDQLSSMRGFIAGLPAEFLEIVGPVKQTTALNTLTDTAFGSSEDTADRFFLASLQQESINPQASGVEGSTWPYWLARLGKTQAQYETLPAHIRYAIESRTSPQGVRLRSALRGHACSTWRVFSSGYAYTHGSSGATYAYRSAPACVIY